ncbi:MAG TPA: diaminopimelate epimerase [Rhodanobacteraceae bacterium]|nr:diaminopimelate epimerase [Rhodanobacteraceae bacterium]
MALAFSKMHGLGNDFVVVDARTQPFDADPARIRAMADRQRGIGFDQLLTIEPARDPSCAFAYGIWNTDGSRANQCGNGVRCVAAWLQRAGALGADHVRLQSPAGAVMVRLLDDGRVAVDMGEPVFVPARIPFAADAEADAYALRVGAQTLTIGAVSLGNPHAVVEVDNPDAPALVTLGPALSEHPRFTQGSNAGFVSVSARDRVRLRVHERGAGWTLACGTGACAAMAVLRRRGRVDAEVAVELPGGTLTIVWPGPDATLWMTGPAAFAYEGIWPA